MSRMVCHSKHGWYKHLLAPTIYIISLGAKSINNQCKMVSQHVFLPSKRYHLVAGHYFCMCKPV